MRTDRIADLYRQPGPFASAFVDVSRESETGAHEVELRVRDACDRLAQQQAPEAVVERVRGRLDTPAEPSPVSRTVVANDSGILFDALTYAHPSRPIALWGDLPDLGGWLTHEDRAVAFVLALVDHEGGDVSAFRSDAPEPDETEVAGDAEAHEHKTRGGGLAHMRYQRTAENVWAHNADEVARALRSMVSDGHRLLIIAGDPGSRTKVLDSLSAVPGAEVVELEHGGRARDGGDESLAESVRDVLARHSAAERLATVHTLEDRLGSAKGAVTGVGDVADALVRGQVDSMLLDPVAASELSLRPSDHPGLPIGSAPPEKATRADLALLAAAAQTGVDVGVLASGAIPGAPAAALLRWQE